MTLSDAEARLISERARVIGERLAYELAIRVGANQSERESIVELEATVRHGARHMDLTVRKDGKEYHFEVDWLKRLFQPYSRHEGTFNGS